MSKRKPFIVITALLGILLIVSGFAVSAFVHNRLTENLIIQYSNQEGIAAQQVAQNLQLEIAETEAKLALIAQLPEVVSGDAATCNKKLQELITDPNMKLGNLVRVNAEGYFDCSVNKSLIGLKADTFGSYFDQIFSDPEHKPVMGRAVKVPGVVGYAMGVHVPIWDSNGKFIGTLGGGIYLNDLEQEYLQSPLVSGSYVTLYDDDGTVLYHYKPELIGLNIASPQFQQYVKGGSAPEQAIADIKNGVAGTRQYSFDGDKKISVFEPVHIFPGRNWRVSEVIPISALHNSIVTVGIDRLLIELPIVLCILIALLFLFFIWVISRRVFRPMEAIDKAKSEFVGIASHELRTPLGIIKWYINAIKSNDYVHTAPEKALDYLSEIEKSNERLLELVHDLLTVAHIDEKRVTDKQQAVDILPTLQEVVEEMKIEAGKKGIFVQCSFPHTSIPQVVLDVRRLREVIENVLSNAIKYSHQKGKIHLLLEIKADKILISIQDHGIGIPKTADHNMFSRFFRADNALKTTAQGNGLGLYAVFHTLLFLR